MQKEIAMPTAKERPRKAAATSIRLTLPISVARDLEKFQQALANVAVIVGAVHLAGGDKSLRSRTREFVIDAASLKVKEAVAEQ